MTKENYKYFYLIFSFLFVLITAYHLAISKTLDRVKEYNELNRDSQLYNNIPSQLATLKQKEDYYDSLLSKYQIGNNSLENNLLKTVNTFASAHQIKLSSYVKPHILMDNNLQVYTYQFTLEGDYKSVIKLIYKLEQETKFGEIINLSFEKKRNYKTKKYYLQTRFLLKSFG